MSTNLNKPVLRSSKVRVKPVLKKRDSKFTRWVKTFFAEGIDLKGYPQYIESLLEYLPPTWQGEGIQLETLYRSSFELYRKLLEFECPVEILSSIWVQDLGPIYFGLLFRNPDIKEEEMNRKFLKLAKYIKALLDGFQSIKDMECIVNAFQLKVLSDIKHQGDILIDVKPEFYPYSTDVMTLAKSKKRIELQKGKRMFGIELEFSHSNHTLKDLSPLLQMGIFKYDSSVDGEYVTLPYIYEEMVTKISNLSETFDKLLSANGSSGNGMHIHVSRDALTNEQMLNLQTLLNPSTEEGKAYWSLIADRELEGNQWCSFTNLEEWKTEGGKGLYTRNRYVILNFTNKHTIEFRMFKSPTSTQKVLWNLSIIKGLIEFSKRSNSFEYNKKPDSLEDWMISPLNPMNN